MNPKAKIHDPQRQSLILQMAVQSDELSTSKLLLVDVAQILHRTNNLTVEKRVRKAFNYLKALYLGQRTLRRRIKEKEVISAVIAKIETSSKRLSKKIRNAIMPDKEVSALLSELRRKEVALGKKRIVRPLNQ